MKKTHTAPEITVSDRKIWIIPVVIMLGILVSAFVFVIPQIRAVIDLHSQNKEKKEELVRLREKLEVLESIDEFQQDEFLDRIETVLPSHKPVLETLALLAYHAEDLSLQLEDYELKPGAIATESADLSAVSKQESEEESRGELLGFELETTVTGAPVDVDEFFRRIDGLAPLMEITKLSMDLSGDDVSVLAASNSGELSAEDERSAEVNLQVRYALPPLVEAEYASEVAEITVKQEEILDALPKYFSVNDMPAFYESYILTPPEEVRENLFDF